MFAKWVSSSCHDNNLPTRAFGSHSRHSEAVGGLRHEGRDSESGVARANAARLGKLVQMTSPADPLHTPCVPDLMTQASESVFKGTQTSWTRSMHLLYNYTVYMYSGTSGKGRSE